MAETLEKKYEENVGHPPRTLPEDHPDYWQWTYKGGPAERATLLDMLSLDGPDSQPPQEETLWDVEAKGE